MYSTDIIAVLKRDCASLKVVYNADKKHPLVEPRIPHRSATCEGSVEGMLQVLDGAELLVIIDGVELLELLDMLDGAELLDVLGGESC